MRNIASSLLNCCVVAFRATEMDFVDDDVSDGSDYVDDDDDEDDISEYPTSTGARTRLVTLQYL